MTNPHIRKGPDVQELIRLSAGAALVGVHSRTLRRWIDQGKLTGWRIASNQIRVSRAELLNLATPMGESGRNEVVESGEPVVGR